MFWKFLRLDDVVYCQLIVVLVAGFHVTELTIGEEALDFPGREIFQKFNWTKGQKNSSL